MIISIFGNDAVAGLSGCNSIVIRLEIIDQFEHGSGGIDVILIGSFTFVFVFLLPGGLPLGRDIPGIYADVTGVFGVQTGEFVTLIIVDEVGVVMLVVVAFATEIFERDGLEFVLPVATLNKMIK